MIASAHRKCRFCGHPFHIGPCEHFNKYKGPIRMDTETLAAIGSVCSCITSAPTVSLTRAPEIHA